MCNNGILKAVILCGMTAVVCYGEFLEAVNAGSVDNEDINEASGLAASRWNSDLLWTHNDRGHNNRIFAIDTQARYLDTFFLEDCMSRDWEDIAAGPGPDPSESYLYVGEIGDNFSEYDIKYVYRLIEPRFDESEIPFVKTVPSGEIDRLQYRYPDGNRDAEALVVDPWTKDYYIISKREENVRVYKSAYPQPLDRIDTLVHVATLGFGWVTAADISPDGEEILVKNYDNVFYWKRSSGESIADVFARDPVIQPYLVEPQGEAICWDIRGDGYFTLSEGYYQPLYYYGRAAIPEEPRISSVIRSPVSPSPDDSVEISATVTDNIGVASVVLKWGTISGSLTNDVTMDADGDNYAAHIPAQSAGTEIFYRIEASDSDENITVTQEQGYNVVISLSVWHSYQVSVSNGSPQASVSGDTADANLEFYESTDNDGIAQSSLFGTYSESHADGFNNLGPNWSSDGTYPYIGKSSVARGDDTSEGNVPDPAGVYDLQFHPPDNDHLAVCAFTVPLTGSYKVADLAIRRVYDDGSSVSVKLFDSQGMQLTELISTGRSWTVSDSVYDLGEISAGGYIWFGVDNVDGYAYDAAEVNWTVQMYGNTATDVRFRTHSNQIKNKAGFPETVREVFTLSGRRINVSGSDIKEIKKLLAPGTYLIRDNNTRRILFVGRGRSGF